ncbi:helix-turn-helix domain-containing protein [Chryseobacterium arachidis]
MRSSKNIQFLKVPFTAGFKKFNLNFMRPNYTKIYQDMLKEKAPEKLEDPKIQRLIKKLKTTEDILNFNDLVFTPSKESSHNNQKLRIYDKKTILKLLDYQKKHELSISFMSKKYKISRTTISRWKRLFAEDQDNPAEKN